ncbi:MAG TPA: DUF4012 domain-containing protein, partial [Chloroflexota bacterium]|nr:DUF4012 domain-containing protein [Chloroflexota bacterium]
ALAGLPVSTGNSGLNTALAKLRRDLPRLNTAAVWLSAAPTLLGWNAPQRYLVALENSAEIRPVGGFIGAADLLTVHKGYLTKRFTGASLPHEIPFHHLPLQEAELTSESDWLFRDSNASPDFPTSARLERWFYGQDTGRWANGVLDFIDLGVADLLQKLGPLYVPQYHLTVTPQNAQALAQRFAGPGSVTTAYRGPQTVGSPDTLRKQFLGFELSAMLSKLESLPSSRWSALAGALSLLVAKHDLLFYDRNPTVEQATIASGDSGSLTPRVGDFVYIVDDNRSYNKLAPYVQEWASYNTEILPDMWQDSVLTIHYHVNPSPANLEGLGPDYGTKGTKHDYEDAVRVFVPPGATLDSISPSVKLFTPSAAQPAYGMMAFSGYFIVREGQSATITFRYHLPANVFSWSGYHHYRLTIPRQPGAELRWMGVHVQTVAGVRLKTPGGALVQSYHAGFPMTQDRVLNLAIGGRTDPQPVPATGPINTGDPFLPLWAFRRYHLHPF